MIAGWTSPTIRGRCAYTVLGFIGYIVAAGAVAVLGAFHGISLGERLVVQLVPPLSLLAVVTLTRYRRGKERIVSIR